MIRYGSKQITKPECRIQRSRKRLIRYVKSYNTDELKKTNDSCERTKRRSSEPKHINARHLAVTTQKRQNEEQIEPLTNNQIKKIKAVYQTKTAE